MRKKNRKKMIKIGFLVAGIILIATGVKTLMSGNLMYSNYWGGAVFSPISIIIGCFLVFISIFKSDFI